MTPIGNRRKKTEDCEKLDEAFKILSRAATNHSNEEHNECQIFGNLVAKKLTKYSSELQSTVQQDIINILFKADREHHNKPSSSSGPAQSYHSRTFHSCCSNPRTTYTELYQGSQEVNYTPQQPPLPSPAYTYGDSSNYSSSSDITPGDSSLQRQLLDVMNDRELQDM